MSGSYCRSLYPFSGEQHPQGLSFHAGDMIEVLQAAPGGWWRGRGRGPRAGSPPAMCRSWSTLLVTNIVGYCEYLQNIDGYCEYLKFIVGYCDYLQYIVGYCDYLQYIRTASLCQLPVEGLRDPLPPQWRCYMSPQGCRYYVNTTSDETTWERPSSAPGTQTPKRSATDPPCQQSPGSTSATRKQNKETTVTVNCVTFPSLACMQEQQLLKPNEWSYCDFFWADKKDPQGTSCLTGFEVLLQKQLKGKQIQKEMAEFIRERTVGECWAQLKKSLEDEAEVHLKFSSKLQSEVEKPLLTFRENFKKDMKRYEHHIADLRKQLGGRHASVEKARKALADRQKDLELKTQQLEIKLSNKIEEDIKKARRKSTQAGDDLMRCVDLYNQSQSRWFEETVTTSLELERLEVERVEMIRHHLCQYTTLRHETDMFNQSLLQSVDPIRDRELWVEENKTGEIRPVNVEI
ncbi:hypothetical protein F7725_021406 [Dissostichus mawsoni]|uniref:Growth arrest specific 7 n=1 Tax=Dissostichus mawsoni TaxID=36200 RepID=A0A7J5ZE52_DISMA|nr:hypothetical protein F7725_021406 [Dissostichus mawsoni]